MQEETNKKRAERAETLIKAYHHSTGNLGDIEDYFVTDMIADLMHYCRSNDIDIEGTIEMAFLNFHEELLEEEQDKQPGDDFS